MLETSGEDNPTLKVAMGWRRSLNDEYFVKRKLYPNIDFYSGITLRAMGFPTSMFTGCSRSRARSAGSRNGPR